MAGLQYNFFPTDFLYPCSANSAPLPSKSVALVRIRRKRRCIRGSPPRTTINYLGNSFVERENGRNAEKILGWKNFVGVVLGLCVCLRGIVDINIPTGLLLDIQL
ncbi:hypothetical protein TorRG33x02_061780 [Trema orientale]|uniref:Uncharacterized protein n=1 Tax=Trema orientale TaxID=63057 RepID=A0A2P5FJZ9_TREOI|nr:hypothetical protein TorRG33x02_061780 [Trema orientale]